MTSDTLSRIRGVMMGGAGALCLLYAVLALSTGRPDPLPIWITGAGGVLAAGVIWISVMRAGNATAAQSFDEGFHAEILRAQRNGFWVAIWLYPVFGLLLWQNWVSWPVAFATMGCLTAASYLLSVLWYDWQGRG